MGRVAALAAVGSVVGRWLGQYPAESARRLTRIFGGRHQARQPAGVILTADTIDRPSRTSTRQDDFPMAEHSISDFEAVDISGKRVRLADLAGKVMLIVNTASQCGFTPQFGGLETLWQAYRDQGLVILGFPSNEFGRQDPGSNDEIASFCQLNYGVSFPMMAKIEVNGGGTDPLYQWLKAEAPGLLGSKAIKWNFTKFLVGRDGQVIRRYAPQDAPEKLAGDIEAALQAKA
jgi:glutathione peroxidase